MSDPQMDALRREFSDYLTKHRLTPDDIEGKLYRLSFWRAFYVLLCLVVIVGVGIVAPVVIALEGEVVVGLLLGAFFWYALAWTPLANGREALAEHVVYSWCAKRDVPRTMWLRMQSELVKQMPPRVRWFAKYVDPPRTSR